MLKSFQVIEVNVMVFKKPEDAYFEILCPPPFCVEPSKCVSLIIGGCVYSTCCCVCV